jgi:hypothetical protein
MKTETYNKRPYSHLLKTDRKEYHRLASQEYRQKHPDRFPIKDEWRKLDKNLFNELPNDVIPVKDFPTYYVRPNGEVWRDTRGYPSAVKTGKERVLRLTPTFNAHNGYWLVQPYQDNKKKAIHLHRFILTAFEGPAPTEGMECHHIDADTSNNAIDNLMWVTRQQNIDFSNPGRRKGIPNSKPSNSRWSPYHSQILELLDLGLRPVDVATRLGIPKGSMYMLVEKIRKRNK